ncbi:thiamine pyrophosphokinase-related protein-like protein [Saccharata proteae CBS 121410]|uniref:Thiamine pyrophosphokinase-related protein-like protein n=1 Tax=Saccharata proteae CBS 121410 TaxID=1314787 RepID=A0A9P4LT93_9PEZI|nr:thiamine pyrophosphokinase-related protein-like protein [Saccharata proteae CBS 121410]
MEKSNLDLINDCDNFPYYETDPHLYDAALDRLYTLQVASDPYNSTLGFVLPLVAETLRGLPQWTVDDDEHTLTLKSGRDEAERTIMVAQTTAAMREVGHFQVLKGWRDELFPVFARDGALLFKIERAASALFGVVSYGVHMTCYVRAGDAIKVWVPRRSQTKSTYPGMLDNTVAGGLPAGEKPFNAVIREAEEEASLPAELVRERAKAVGVVSYFLIRDERAGGETGLLQPESQYVYDMEVPEDVVPKPNDDEVEGFALLSIEEIKVALLRGEFKPNCALVMLDFFVRHGILTPENEKHYIDIVTRLHRRFEFPTIRDMGQE